MPIRADHAQRTMLAVTGFAALAILLLAWGMRDAARAASRSQALVLHTEEVLREVSDLRGSLALAESGHRGFLLTGDRAFRVAREDALAQARAQAADLDRQVIDNPLQRARTRRLSALIEHRVEVMHETERALSERGHDEALRMFAAGRAEQAMARIRGLVDALAREETRLLSVRQQEDRQGQARVRRMLAIAVLVVLALTLFVLWGIVEASRGRRRAESRLRAIAHSLPGAVYVARQTPDGHLRFDFLSLNAGNIMGADRKLALQDAGSIRQWMPEEDRERLNAAIEESAATLAPLEVDFRVRKADGSLRWVRSSGIPVREPGGDVVWNGYWFDITEMKVAEQALRDAMRRLNDAQSVASLGDWTCDLATGEVTWSPQVYQMLERDPALGPPPLAEGVRLFEDGTNATAEAFFKAQETREPQAYETTATLTDGVARRLHVIVVPSIDGDGAVVGMHGTIQDISARKALEDRLSRAKEAADRASLAKSDFLATMSHEIRTPLNGMLGILELVGLMPLNPELQSALEGVRESGRSLQRIIDDILDFSKVEAGKLEIRPEPTSIAEVVVAVHRNYSGSASSRGLEMRHRVDPRISAAVMVDGLRLQQILGNFVSNAIKYTPRGHVELRAILLRRDEISETLRFEIEDTGVGISPERQVRLFQPYEQAELDVASRVGGTGLGLAISRRLARLMGGEVGMASAVGAGTTMSLELTVAAATPLPRVVPAGNPVAGTFPPPALEPPSVNQAVRDGMLVLVVDDHPINRMVMRRQLNTLGYAVEEAEGGEEALQRWRSGSFALILTDCNMPRMSGYELTRRIRAMEASAGKARIPVIACSANVIGGAREACLEAGMDDYIAKPTELASLAQIMARWLPLPATARSASVAGATQESAESAARAPPLDRGAGISAGASAADRRALAQFRRINDADAALLASAVARRDFEAVAHLAHRIKGACGFVGASPLAAASARLEHAARAGDGAALDELMPEFSNELERLNAHLDAEQ